VIFGRPPALFAAAFAAIVNAVVLLQLGGVTLTTEQVAGLNVAFSALIALIAGTPLTDHEALAAAAARRAAK
jgi:hypothetical protein